MAKNIKLLAIDLAKDVFQLHGNDENGRCVLRKTVNRKKLSEFMANLPCCKVAMEACGGCHHWGRLFVEQGHDVMLIAPQFVKPYVKSNKNDANDAEAIAEAASRPSMRFVALKTQAQQTMLTLHRARELAKKQRTSQSNQIRGLLSEYGMTLPVGIHHLKQLPRLLSEHSEKLGQQLVDLFMHLYDLLQVLDKAVKHYDTRIEASIADCPLAQEMLNIDGVGVMVASAMIATIGDPNTFKNGREVAAWLGLTPKQHTSGGKVRLGGISKRGDNYARSLLIHGARATLRYAPGRTDKKSIWITQLKNRSAYNNAAVALANKHARIIWAIMKTGECYDPAQAAA